MFWWRPLTAAVYRQHHDVVVWLLSHGADPNGDKVMAHGTFDSSAAILELLIDAGGDVNRESYGQSPVFIVLEANRDDSLRVLLAQPCLDFTVDYYGKSPHQYAQYLDNRALADIIAQEVRREGVVVCF